MNGLNKKRSARVQAKAYAISKSDSGGDDEEGEEGDEEVVVVKGEAALKKKAYIAQC
jgi:hypothetical protein